MPGEIPVWERPQEYWSELADRIDRLQQLANDGRGHSVARQIAICLKRGEVRDACAIAFNDGDKFELQPELKELIERELPSPYDFPEE